MPGVCSSVTPRAVVVVVGDDETLFCYLTELVAVFSLWASSAVYRTKFIHTAAFTVPREMSRYAPSSQHHVPARQRPQDLYLYTI